MKYVITLLIIIFFSCSNSSKEQITTVIKKWENKEILFPKNIIFTKYGKDTINYNYLNSKYKILIYIDSIGCTSCKLQLTKWKDFIIETDSVTKNTLSFNFFFHPKNNKEIYYLLKREDFQTPICIDSQDSLNKLNNFPKEMMFQTFLLDKDNKVIAIGNPIHNPKVKELYLKIITGKEQVNNKNRTETSVQIEKALIEMGELDWQKPHDAVFTIKNIGNNLLVVDDIDTTCGCTSANYVKKPVGKGDNLDITVTIKPKNKGYFEETITVYCNAENSPIQLKIKGNAI